MIMTIPILLLILGLAVIAAGAHFMVEGSSRIASKFGISELVIGMTVVAIGTGKSVEFLAGYRDEQ